MHEFCPSGLTIFFIYLTYMQLEFNNIEILTFGCDETNNNSLIMCLPYGA